MLASLSLIEDMSARDQAAHLEVYRAPEIVAQYAGMDSKDADASNLSQIPRPLIRFGCFLIQRALLLSAAIRKVRD